MGRDFRVRDSVGTKKISELSLNESMVKVEWEGNYTHSETEVITEFYNFETIHFHVSIGQLLEEKDGLELHGLVPARISPPKHGTVRVKEWASSNGHLCLTNVRDN